MINKQIQKIKTSYMNYFKIKGDDIQIIITDDMYNCQKKYGFTEDDQKVLNEKPVGDKKQPPKAQQNRQKPPSSALNCSSPPASTLLPTW